jgi:hypothetical protein
MTKALSFVTFAVAIACCAGACSGAQSKSPPPSSPASPTTQPPKPATIELQAPPIACAGKACGEPCTVCAVSTEECPPTPGRCNRMSECVRDPNLVCPAARVAPGIKSPEELALMGP